MRFKTDENLPIEAAEILRTAGYDALTVDEQSLNGAPDENIEEVCRAEGRILVTLDLDFADLRRYPLEGSPGRIVLRLRQQDKQHVLDVLRRLEPVLKQHSAAGRLWIVTEETVRMRS